LKKLFKKIKKKIGRDDLYIMVVPCITSNTTRERK